MPARVHRLLDRVIASRTFVCALPLLASVAVLASACGRPAASASSTAPAASDSAAASPDAGPLMTSGRVSGTVSAVTGTRVRLINGTQFDLSPASRITRSRPGNASDLQAGQFVAITADRQDDALLALRINVFAEASRGQGAGQRPMETGNIMTNATIDGTIDDLAGGEFDVSFPDGRDHVRLAPGVEIEVRTDAALQNVQPGSAVTAVIHDGVAQSLSIQSTG